MLGRAGARLSKKSLDVVSNARGRAQEACTSVLSGFGLDRGGLRTEVTYLYESCGGGFGESVEVMAADLLGEVYGADERGWNDESSAVAVPPELVHNLFEALFQRSLGTIECGFELCGPGNGPSEQLPLGHLVSIAERALSSGALVQRMGGGVGPELRAGLSYSGFLGEAWVVYHSPASCIPSRSCQDKSYWSSSLHSQSISCPECWLLIPFAVCTGLTAGAESLAVAGGDDQVPLGLLVGSGLGRVRGVFGSDARRCVSRGLESTARKTRGVSELRKDGGEGLKRSLTSVLRVIMETARGEKQS